MNILENQLHYPFADELPEPGKKMQMAPGVYWLRMPLPFALDHINLWLIRDQFQGCDGWTAIDCGVGTDETREHWTRLIARELDGLPIVRVLCTHYHPDHMGNAAWLTEKFKIPLWMTLGEYTMGRVIHAGLAGTHGSGSQEHFSAHGLPPTPETDKLSQRANRYARLVPDMPVKFRRIVDGERIVIGQQNWRVICGYGHSPEHAALYAEGLHVLISGDMLLPRISTNIGVNAMEPESNPLQQFLSSIDRIGLMCAPDTLVLPSHGRPFRQLHIRIHQLHQHHDDRLEEVRELCRHKPATAADVLPVMFKRKLDAQQMYFAFGEALAHLHYLWYTGEVQRERGSDGVYRFKPVA